MADLNPRHVVSGLLNLVRGLVSPGRQRESSRINSINFARGAVPGALAIDVFDKIRGLPGWFNYDDCANFFLVLTTQSMLGLRGDVLEIGTYHGRSTCVLASCLRTGERLVVCDAFERDTDDPYVRRATPETLWANLVSVNPGLDRASLDIHSCYSQELMLDPGPRFRFAHVDGGHSKETALHDLELCADRLLPPGVIVADDYCHPRFPEVTDAVDSFLSRRPDFAVLADLNRHGAIGRKIYLARSTTDGSRSNG